MIRIKTKQEFIKEFGVNWRDFVAFNKGLNGNFGKILSHDQVEFLALCKYVFISGNSYDIIPEHLTNAPLPEEKAFTKKNLRKLHDMISNAYMLEQNLIKSLDIIQHLIEECED